MSIKLTLLLIVGIVVGFYFRIASEVSLFILLGLLPLLFFAARKQARRGIPFFEVLTAAASIFLGIFVTGLATHNSLDKSLVQDNGIWELKVIEVLKPTTFSNRYIAKIQFLNQHVEKGKLVLTFRPDSTKTRPKIDDELILFGNPEEINPPLNPHSFDYKDYLSKQGIYHQVRADYKNVIVKDDPKPSWYGRASRFREHIISKLKQKAFGEEELAVIQALLLGQREDISEETYSDYKNAGAVHILAVSGLHVGIFLLLFQFLLSPLERLPKGKTLKLVVVVLLLWAYAFIAGLSPSIVRAVTMFTFLAYAMHLNRPTNAFNILALSMFFILLIKPLFLFQVGFQMSYAAVFAIIWVYPKLQRFWFPENLVLQKIWQLLSVSIAAQLGVLPISLYYFHQFPALFFVSNLLVVPFLGILLGSGILVIILSLIDLLPKFLVSAYDFLIGAMNNIVAWVGRQEHFIITDIPFDSVQLVSWYVLIVSLIIAFSKPSFRKLAVPAMVIIVLQVYGILDLVVKSQKESLIVGHQSKGTVLMHHHGKNLTVYANEHSAKKRMVQTYAVAEKLDSITYESLKNNYTVQGKSLYIMDSLGMYPKQAEYLLLTQSPKINLDRLLQKASPKIVIADASNYRNLVKRWKQTCYRLNVPFHYTGESGAYLLRPSDR
ncbi:ComEC/Rec2 family competence protein [Flagellimonas myxillae]|uniref:ComEC/Rec2 family competence protein n=1 Tax=Flagellimonas myxillae TaxID=2942214 RepID=UPI00201E9565|nr:ComEC/Rec2 family competence protein [Muricauda myxillae]MCL6267685.1 ComEC family competence protein [Muricauda myxillae]